MTQKLRELHEQYGQVVRVGPNEVSTSDWSVYRDIYSGKASTKSKAFYDVIRAGGVHLNIFSMQNKEQHAARRKLENQSYSRQAILQNQSLIAEKANVLVRRLVKTAEDSHSSATADFYDLSGLFSLEVILKCALNRDYGDSPAGDSLTILKAMDGGAISTQLSTALSPIVTRKTGVYFPGFIGHAFRQHNVYEEMTKELLAQFERQHEASPSDTSRFMVAPMLTHTDGFLGRRLTKEEVLEEVMGLTFAGSGTTSTTLTYLVYSLARDATLQDQLREELRAVPESLLELQSLPLLNAIIKETFRMYPTIMSTLPRVLDHPLQVGKHVLPARTIVGMQNYVHHRDSNLFPQPDDFIPERWLETNCDEKRIEDMNAALTPFSLGSRNCIGQNLARAELHLATSKIFKRLRLTLNAQMTDWDMEMEDRFNIAPRGRRLLVDVEVL